MSYWYIPKLEDLNLSDDRTELQALLGSDESGNIWVSIDVEDIKKILKK